MSGISRLYRYLAKTACSLNLQLWTLHIFSLSYLPYFNSRPEVCAGHDESLRIGSSDLLTNHCTQTGWLVGSLFGTLLLTPMVPKNVHLVLNSLKIHLFRVVRLVCRQCSPQAPERCTGWVVPWSEIIFSSLKYSLVLDDSFEEKSPTWTAYYISSGHALHCLLVAALSIWWRLVMTTRGINILVKCAVILWPKEVGMWDNQSSFALCTMSWQ